MQWPRTLTIPRKPDFVIGSPEAPYMRRWWVIPRNRFFNIYLHQILRDDDDRALHDHPWASCSVILRGGYIEWTGTHARADGADLHKIRKVRTPGMIRFRRASAAHRLELHRKDITLKEWRKLLRGSNIETNAIFRPGFQIIPAWTLFITGPKVREWGFHCPKGWKHWRDFVGVREGEARGDEKNVGCGEY